MDLPDFMKPEHLEMQGIGDTSECIDLAIQLTNIDKEIAELEEQLKDAKERRMQIARRDLPAAFLAARTDRIGVPGANVDVIVEDYYHANIPADKKPEAHAWLEKNGGRGSSPDYCLHHVR